MAEVPNHEDVGAVRILKPRPPGFCEFTPRAVICGVLVALLMGASYPYVVLKLGFGPNVSVVSAIFGYIMLGLFIDKGLRALGFRPAAYNRWENNIVQTAGTAAGQTAFMCVLLAAFDMLTQSDKVSFSIHLTPLQSFAWLTSAGFLGVMLAVPLRQHYVVDEKLPYADGMAAGETVLVCESEGPAASRAAFAMVFGIVASAALMSMTKDSHVFGLFESTYLFAATAHLATNFGVEWSLLAIGSGMIIGLRINASMLFGTSLAWLLAPILLRRYGILAEGYKRNDVLFWVMWPATGMMVASGLAALALRWRVLSRTFRNLTTGGGEADEFPIRWAVAGATTAAIALIAVQRFMLGQPVWVTAVAIVLSLPLALVALRVLGETNWGPVSALSNMMQGIFAILAPGNIAANMIASGTTGTVAIESESIMQDYRAGEIVGSSPRYLTYMQLLATPVGAAAVSWMYPVLREQYGIGEGGLSSPISRKWAGFAEVLSRGMEALPPGAMFAAGVGVVVGVLLAVLESRAKDKTWIPSPTGMGIGMLVPASVIVTMFLGSIVGLLWTRTRPKSSRLYQIPLASGLIAGEALVAVIVPLLVVAGILKM